jgi:hypothetical protein
MGLLDELKSKVAARDAQDAALSADVERTNEFLAIALPAMFRIHQNLTELVRQLGVLGEEMPATLAIPGIGTVAGFLQGDYEISAAGKPPDSVSLRCSLRLPRERTLEVLTAASEHSPLLERLRQQGLQARLLSGTDQAGGTRKTNVAIQGSVAASLSFSLDCENTMLQLVSRNFEELSERRQHFNPATVTEQWCEELLRYVVREENSFMRYEVPPELREALRQRLEAERREERVDESAFGLGAMLKIIGVKAPESLPELSQPSLPASAEADLAEKMLAPSAMVRKLLNRKPPLKLRYRGQTIDLAAHDGPFIIGRAPECDLLVEEEHVSRMHVRIELRDDRYHLIDSSRNGTFLRFDDGRAERAHRSEIPMIGSGEIALGINLPPGSGYLIEFAG